MNDRKNKHIIEQLGNHPAHKFIVIGGIHGNEQRGVSAIEHILPELKKVFNPNKGNIYFLKGNIDALLKNERFIDKDLNRLWLNKHIQSKQTDIADTRSLRDLHELISRDICQGKYDNCTLLDLHTFSAKSGIFCIPAGNQKSVEFARSFGVPFIEKLSDMLPGTALSYFGNKGMRAVVFEGGTHDTEEATENLAAGLWHALGYAGLIDDDLEIVQESRKKLIEISKKYPHHLELIYRHKLEDWQNFKMNNGYYNFKPVKKEESLAIQDSQEIKSPAGGFMLMPLYQKKGSDGFFIVKEK